jgi:hypothetical protein
MPRYEVQLTGYQRVLEEFHHTVEVDAADEAAAEAAGRARMQELTEKDDGIWGEAVSTDSTGIEIKSAEVLSEITE